MKVSLGQFHQTLPSQSTYLEELSPFLFWIS